MTGIQKLILRPVQKHNASERHKSCHGLLPSIAPVDWAQAFLQEGQLIPCVFSPEVLCTLQKGFPKYSLSPTERALRFACEGENDSKVPCKHSCSAAWRQGFLFSDTVCGNLNR